MEIPGAMMLGDRTDSNSTSNASLANEYPEQRRAVERMQTPIIKDMSSSANHKASNSNAFQKERYWSRASIASDEEINRRQSKQDKEVG